MWLPSLFLDLPNLFLPGLNLPNLFLDLPFLPFAPFLPLLGVTGTGTGTEASPAPFRSLASRPA
ncbi:MAG TPA: hypothetical protein VGM75_04090 [Pseudonocardiaceae bacterium]|jgi:hypothetical protein